MSVTHLPAVTLVVNGAPLAPAAARGLGTLCVRQRLSQPTQCELAFFQPPGPLDAAEAMPPGTPLQVLIGGQTPPLFSGEVTAVEYHYGPAGQREVRVRGYDRLHRLRKRSPVRVHVDVTPLTLAQELAAGVGLRVADAPGGPRWPHLLQHDRSDLALLVEVAGRAGLYLTVREETLHLLTLAGAGAPLALAWGRTLLEAQVEVSSEAALRSVQVVGWNPLDAEEHQGRADQPRSGRSVTAAAAPDRVGGSGQGSRTGSAVADAQHADLLAQAELDRHAAQEVTLWGVAEGDTRLCPGARIDVSGLAAAVCGRYVLTGVTHTIDAEQGFVSELTTAPPAPLPPTPTREVAALGIVTQVNDPQGVGRVRVRLPGYADLESDWLPVLLPGVSAVKGLVVLPDVGDRVLVLLAGSHAGEGVVLGALGGRRGLPDSGVEGNAVRRYTFQTPGGQRIQLDDGGNLIRLENGGGSFVELTPAHLLIHAAQDLTLEAPGRRVTVRGQAIDFERA